MSDLIPPDLRPMEAKLVDALPEEPGWAFEPKWDGFRCLAFKAGDRVELRAKSGKPLARYFPEVAAMLAAVPGGDFAVDGELVIPTPSGLSFEALQLRLHPAASRVRRLSAESPAMLILFDVLATAADGVLVDRPWRERRAALERLYAAIAPAAPRLRLSPHSEDRRVAERWLAGVGGALDGVVAKAVADPYRPGERAMLKIKRKLTADCVVGGFRYGEGSDLVGSLLLGLYDAEGRLNHVGFTSTISNEERPALTQRLEALKGGPGFTGAAPGGPSRWSTERTGQWVPLRPELVVEVLYDQVTGGRFRHGTRLLRERPDKAPEQCTCEQLAPPAKPPKLVEALVGPYAAAPLNRDGGTPSRSAKKREK